MFALHFMAISAEAGLCEAAAKAGVKWIFPTEYAGDGLNKALVDAVPLFQPKAAARRQIEELAQTYEGLKWIGVVFGWRGIGARGGDGDGQRRCQGDAAYDVHLPIMLPLAHQHATSLAMRNYSEHSSIFILILCAAFVRDVALHSDVRCVSWK